MKIIGNGLIAQAIQPYAPQHDDVTIFASGVAISSEQRLSEYTRECDLLLSTIKHCLAEDRRIVYFSSGGTIYGSTDAPRREDMPLFPTTPYGRHQLLCEALVKQSGVRYMIARLANLVGPGQNSHQLIPALVQAAKTGNAKVFTHASRDLLDIEDFTRVLIAVLDALTASQNLTVTIASGQSIAVPDLFAAIQQELGTNATIKHIHKGDQQIFDITRLQNLLGDAIQFDANYPYTVLHRYIRTYSHIESVK